MTTEETFGFVKEFSSPCGVCKLSLARGATPLPLASFRPLAGCDVFQETQVMCLDISTLPSPCGVGVVSDLFFYLKFEKGDNPFSSPCGV